MTYTEAIDLVISMAEGNKDVWFGQADVEKEKKAIVIVKSLKRLSE